MTETHNSTIKTLAQLPFVQAQERAEEVAIVFRNRRLSFADVERRSNQLAHGLIAEGVDAQQRVAVLDRNNDVFFDVLFGTVKAGAVLVTINFRLALPEIEYVLNDSETRVLFVGREYAEQIDQIR
ncbi:MAG: AMP-binding protein, partial [Pseudomonadales bacterium]